MAKTNRAKRSAAFSAYATAEATTYTIADDRSGVGTGNVQKTWTSLQSPDQHQKTSHWQRRYISTVRFTCRLIFALISFQMHVPTYHSSIVLPSAHKHQLKLRFFAEFSQLLLDVIVNEFLPPVEELTAKDDMRRSLEHFIHELEPNTHLVSFGSSANGLNLRDSDVDFCCVFDSTRQCPPPPLLVIMLGKLLKCETEFHITPLPNARIPVVKIVCDPSPKFPLGLSCDIVFETRLALENTRLLECYAMIDPARVRMMMLFVKIWCKRRRINSPYKGTISSYGYVLLVIFFLVHVMGPPVLPNLQQITPRCRMSQATLHGYEITFLDDIDSLKQGWHSKNTDSVAELLADFFRYFSSDFSYRQEVVSIRAGLLNKAYKRWKNTRTGWYHHDLEEGSRFCIEEPFETDSNVGSSVTREGLYVIRGEFMRATRLLAAHQGNAALALTKLLEELPEGDSVIRNNLNQPKAMGR